MPREPYKIDPIRLKRNGKIKPKSTVVDTLKYATDNHVTWPNYGYKRQYDFVFKRILKNKPIEHLLFLKKKKPDILFIGAGQGDHLPSFFSELNIDHGITPQIDVFSLTKTLSENAQKVVRNDYSNGNAFETLITNPNKNVEFVNTALHKYDLIVANLSIGVHTDYPAHNIFYASLMLNQRGKAYIDIDDTRTQKYMGDDFLGKQKNPDYSLRFKREYIIKFIDRFTEYFNRKYGTNYKFKCKTIGDSYIEITRIL